MNRGITRIVAAALMMTALFSSGYLLAQNRNVTSRKGWEKGRGYGWVWGKDDEVGALNTLGEKDVLGAVKLIKQGKVYPMGIPYDRTSYKWPGHSPAEIITFRSPEGVKRQKDHDFTQGPGNSTGTAWHSCVIFINDNVATQIDGLGHATTGEDNHWYNGYKEADWGGNFGIRKCGAETIPPIVARGILVDIAGYMKVPNLAPHTIITPKMIRETLKAQGTKIQPGDVVFLRTGSLRHWGESGADHETISQTDTAGINLRSARFLVREKGAVMVGSDTSGVEVNPVAKNSTSFMPVHNYLLIEQGVHIAEFHYLEDLAKDKVYEFCYMVGVNPIRGTTAGFTLQPLAIR